MDDTAPPRRNRRFANFIHRLVTEGQSPEKQAAAIGIGVFVGCIPAWGTHLVVVLLVAKVTGLSRLRMYAATAVSNPVFAPFLVWLELQIGSLVLNRHFLEHSVAQARDLGLAGLGAALVIGSIATGCVFGVVAAVMVWTVVPRGPVESRVRRSIEAAAYPYLDLGLGSWLRVRHSLYGHRQLVRAAIEDGILLTASVLDLGCGRGELLAVLARHRRSDSTGILSGVSSNSARAAEARTVLPAFVIIEVDDPETFEVGAVDAIVVWESPLRDAPRICVDLISRLSAALGPRGTLILAWPGRSRTRSPDRVALWLGEAGFETVVRRSVRRWSGSRHLLAARR